MYKRQIPSSLHSELEGSFGGWPEEQLPNTPRYKKAVDIFIEYVLGRINPEVALIWSSEPDKSQHASGVGSDAAQAALRQADAEFGRIMEYISTSSQHQNSDLMILSDHGYSTITEVIDIETLLESSNLAGSDGWLLAQNGGCVLFYLKNQEDIYCLLYTSPSPRD